jgi:hypothetical protein
MRRPWPNGGCRAKNKQIKFETKENVRYEQYKIDTGGCVFNNVFAGGFETM